MSTWFLSLLKPGTMCSCLLFLFLSVFQEVNFCVTEHLRVSIVWLDATGRNLGNKTRVNSTEILLTQMVLHSVVQRIGQVVNTNQLESVLGPAYD